MIAEERKTIKKHPQNIMMQGTDIRKTLLNLVCIETGEKFTSIIAAAEYYDLFPSDISRSARTGKTVGGFTWRYI